MEKHKELLSQYLTPDTDAEWIDADANKVWDTEIVLSNEGVPYVSRDKDILCSFQQNIINHPLPKTPVATVLVTDNN